MQYHFIGFIKLPIKHMVSQYPLFKQLDCSDYFQTFPFLMLSSVISFQSIPWISVERLN